MADDRERAFVLEWRSAVLNSAESSTVKLCLVVLAEWADADGSNCFPSIPTIATKASVNEKTVRRSMTRAEAAGFITRSQKGTEHGWRRFVYGLRIPKGADTVSARSEEAADTLPARHPETCGLSVQNVRTLRPNRAGTESTDLSITYPLPSNKNEADASRPADPIWGTGLRFLQSKGVREKDARGYLGRLIKVVGTIQARALLAQAEDADVVEPIGWLAKAAAIRSRRSADGGRLARDTRTEDELALANEEALARLGATG
ncbi:helix-turn-helix domain-containing protein [Cognatilysobacter bugurensis]|uniref:Helix-turn-helix domain-containing protein n=1 Tax=Cognatilysobacter bugurensis TaxID=543356 RepID=A0A918SW60_9GAMM|nr:helix-turn-helix domain-containing protein [Lysobacter bugurensis]GHA74973.1 hypothetical protein GCM10007067_10050 [Lysobacter bugurensis]